MIHTIGDSHSQVGWTDVMNHHLGPVLCYSFGKEVLRRCDIRNLEISNGDTIIFCLGEIDCRCHVHKHVSETNPYENIINDIVNNYIEAIKINVIISQLRLKNVCVYNVVPTVQKHNTWDNPEYPFLGTDEERKLYVLYFNKKLREKCNENNFIFFDVYDKYTDENGFLNKQLSDGDVHVRDGVYIRNFINENNI